MFGTLPGNDVIHYGGHYLGSMEHIEDVSVVPCTDSKFVQPFRIKYKQVTVCRRFSASCYYYFALQNGKQCLWDCTKIHDR